MTDLVTSSKEAYEKYEELLIKRDVLNKEAYKYQLAYIREFGELLTQAFEAKIKCIEKKKIIAYCQARKNRGEKISAIELDHYINNVMSDYYDELNSMLETNKSLAHGQSISGMEYRKIKRLYYKIAKQIHPDMNPSLKDDETIKDLWNRTVIAYENNQYEELEELDVLVNSYLASINYQHEELEIPDVYEKIIKLNEEIEEIYRNNPYQYKFLLMDNEAVQEFKEEIQDEIDSYNKYIEELDKIIEDFQIERTVS